MALEGASARPARSKHSAKRPIGGSPFKSTTWARHLHSLSRLPVLKVADSPSCCNGAYKADSSQVHRRQGTPQAAGHQGSSEECSRNRRCQEGKGQFYHGCVCSWRRLHIFCSATTQPWTCCALRDVVVSCSLIDTGLEPSLCVRSGNTRSPQSY